MRKTLLPHNHATRFAVACSMITLVASCGTQFSQTRADTAEAINHENDPRAIDPALGFIFERRVDALPIAGIVSYQIWNGDYYPNANGGTAAPVENGMSPMEKYERATGTRGALAWEQQNAAAQREIYWSGHCNGLAAASIAEEEPKRPVTINGITFTVDDIKALLVESWQDAGVTVGLRCDKDPLDTDEFGRYKVSACRDLNPATLYLAATNILGKDGEAFIIDSNATEEVWNSAISEYEAKALPISATQAARLVGSNSGYVFNTNAKTFWNTTLTLKLATTGSQVIYRFVLEGDAQGRVFGGEWIGESKTDHPDFIWRPGQQKAANPYLDYTFVSELLRKSI